MVLFFFPPHPRQGDLNLLHRALYQFVAGIYQCLLCLPMALMSTSQLTSITSNRFVNLQLKLF